MPIYQRCDESVPRLSRALLDRFESHHPVRDAKVTIDFVFAFPSEDENGVPQGDALTKGGVKCLGLCRIVPTKDRVLGRADAEISIDGEWWQDASDDERAALLDHELHHISVKKKNGHVLTDDARRPKLALRKHDVEIGWFDAVAVRHGLHSMERIQARKIFDERGQLYWPLIAGEGDGKLPTGIIEFDGKQIKVPAAMLTGGAR